MGLSVQVRNSLREYQRIRPNNSKDRRQATGTSSSADPCFNLSLAVQDDLAPVFSRIEQANAIILGSPIYFGDVSGEMKSFMERLLFQYLTYTEPLESLFPNKIKTGFIYTMNVPEEIMQEWGYAQTFNRYEMWLRRILGESEYMSCFDTYQFDDYSKVLSTRFDPVKKAQRRKEIFPEDCEKAFDMGVRFTKSVG